MYVWLKKKLLEVEIYPQLCGQGFWLRLLLHEKEITEYGYVILSIFYRQIYQCINYWSDPISHVSKWWTWWPRKRILMCSLTLLLRKKISWQRSLFSLVAARSRSFVTRVLGYGFTLTRKEIDKLWFGNELQKQNGDGLSSESPPPTLSLSLVSEILSRKTQTYTKVVTWQILGKIRILMQWVIDCSCGWQLSGTVGWMAGVKMRLLKRFALPIFPCNSNFSSSVVQLNCK